MRVVELARWLRRRPARARGSADSALRRGRDPDPAASGVAQLSRPLDDRGSTIRSSRVPLVLARTAPATWSRSAPPSRASTSEIASVRPLRVGGSKARRREKHRDWVSVVRSTARSPSTSSRTRRAPRKIPEHSLVPRSGHPPLRGGDRLSCAVRGELTRPRSEPARDRHRRSLHVRAPARQARGGPRVRHEPRFGEARTSSRPRSR